MTSYEEQLQNFGKEIDDLEEKKKKRGRTSSTNQPQTVALGIPPPSKPSSGRQPVRVVGFGSESEITMNVPQSKPVSIPSASPVTKPKTAVPTQSPPLSNSQSPPAIQVAPRSLEELKGYESKIQGWSDSTPSPSPSPTSEMFSFEEKMEKREKELPPTTEGKEKPQPKPEPKVTAPPKTSTTPTPAPVAAPAPTASTTPAPTTSTPPTAQQPAPNPAGKATGFVKPEKPKLSRTERRALQEAQRAAKAAKTGKPVGKEPNKPKEAAPPPDPSRRKPQPAAGAPASGPAGQAPASGQHAAGAAGAAGAAAGGAPKAKEERPKSKYAAEDEKMHPLFSHLPQHKKISTQALGVGFAPSEKIHPAIIQLGLKYANGLITGSNARCVAMLTAFKDVIMDFNTPPGTALHRTLEPHLKPQIQFLTDCRPHSISMGNVINFIKREIPKTANCATEEEAKESLVELIDNYIKERIIWADKAIAEYGVTKINDGDVILTYARSHSVQSILEAAQEEGKKFRVIIVDSRPKREGKELMRRLMKLGVNCTYVLINAVSYVMKEATKVLVGAFTLFANGNVMSRAGTAVVAMMAQAYGVPVIVCCETYKFCERVQIDSICFNELADPDELVRNPDIQVAGVGLQDWRQRKNLKLLNIAHDVTPSSFVTLVVTEVGMIPPTSVPVVLREYAQQ